MVSSLIPSVPLPARIFGVTEHTGYCEEARQHGSEPWRPRIHYIHHPVLPVEHSDRSEATRKQEEGRAPGFGIPHR